MQFTVPAELGRVRDAAHVAVQRRGLALKIATDTQIVVQSGFEFRSWGERIAITLAPVGWETKVTMQSQPTAQLVDWGRGSEHLAALAASIREIIRAG